MTDTTQTSTPPAETAAPATPPPADGGEGKAPEPSSTETEAKTEAPAATGILSSTEADEPGANKNETAPEGDKAEAEQSTPEGELKVELPEGATINPERMDSFKALAKEAGLTSEQATALAKWEVEQGQAHDAETAKLLEEQDAGWQKDLAGDKEYGGDNLEATSRLARHALKMFGGQELVDSIVAMGLQNWPPLVKAFADVGKAHGEDKANVESGGAGAPKPTGAERRRREYPSMYDKEGRPVVGTNP